MVCILVVEVAGNNGDQGMPQLISVSVFSDHRRVNLYLRVWLGWCARRTQGFILVRTEHPYV